MNNTLLMESYEGLQNRSDDQLISEIYGMKPGCPTPRITTYYDRNNLTVEERSLSPYGDFIDFNYIR